MNQWLGAMVLVAGFIILIQLLGLTKQSKDVVNISLYSLKIISTADLSDEQKEVQLQKNSLKLLVLFLILLFKGAIALLLPLAILWLSDRLGWLNLSGTLETTVSPLFLLFSSVVAILVFWLKPNKPSLTPASPTNRYSPLDRTLHQLAFNTYGAQTSLARLEERIFASQLAACTNEQPVFITALPRAGTTLLLECCANSPEFAAHCYRDLPFVMVPCFWHRFSQIFQHQVKSIERAHGDGMEINADSHEALEEVIWQTFWQTHYHRDRIIPWDYEENREFEQFFSAHQRKIIWLRRDKLKPSVRYISKNNANIARIKVIKKLFPDSIIVVPFRDPLQHASSLLQQHRNFLRIHQADPFAAEYMQAIGHYDFGANLRPLDFDAWLDSRQTSNTQSLAFWLEYWIASYKHLLQENSQLVHFFDYDELCHHSDRQLQRLATILNSDNPQALLSSASRIHPPQPRTINTSNLPSSLIAEAQGIRQGLQEMSLQY